MAALCSLSCALCAFALQSETYGVEFYWDKAGENAENGYKAYMAEYATQLKKPEDPQREGKVFVGWNDWDTEQPVDWSNAYMDNVGGRKFYAVWADEYYKATFYVDGQVFVEVTNAFGEAFIHPRLPEKAGYTFKCWTPELPQTTPAYDVSFNAVFEPNKYIATFLVDGEVYKQVAYTYGQKSVQLPKIPEKSGYIAEWENYSLGIGGVEINAIYTPIYKVRSVSIDNVKVNYNSSAKITPKVEADSGVEYSFYYIVSNPNIASVDEYGNVTAKERGTTSVICIVTDQYGTKVSDVAEITVRFAWWQWLIYIFLFGFLWY